MTYKTFPFFSFRVPVLPYKNLNNYLRDSNIISKYLSNKKTQEAIFLASPILHKELYRYLEGKITSPKNIDHLIFSLERYLSRMSTRCTPFGLFAGIGFGEIRKDTHIIIEDCHFRKTRLDMLYLTALYDAIIKIPNIKEKLKLYKNNSLYPIGKKYRYTEYQYIQTQIQYQIAEIDRTAYLDKILTIAFTGANIQVLIDCLRNDGISEGEATWFINELIDLQILTTELSRAVTGEDFLTRIIKVFESTDKEHELLYILKDIASLLKKIDVDNNNEIEIYSHIRSLVDKTQIAYNEKFLFQVDMIKQVSEASIGVEIIEELQSAITFLNKITPYKKNETLSLFQEDFSRRYEEREVSLAEVLDTELGLGYPSMIGKDDPSPLIEDFILPYKKELKHIISSDFNLLLYPKIMECLAKKNIELVFTDDELKGFISDWTNLPPTIYTLFDVIRAKPDNTLIKLNVCCGSCGANLLARFAHVDSNIERFIKEIIKKEQELMPDAVFAEIVHLPESRTGNILFRPHLRKYEIIYLSYSDLSQKQLLDISDLMLSVRNGKLYLRSKKLNKEIIPRLTTAHNYRKGLPIYKFLCDMQVQSMRNSLHWWWGNYEHYFYHRVRYKNTILFPATWNFTKERIDHLFAIYEQSKLLQEVVKWRECYNIPRYVLMVEADNKLFVDWKSELSIRALFSVIKNKPSVTFEEFLFELENAVVKDKKGNAFLNECIVVFHKNEQ